MCQNRFPHALIIFALFFACLAVAHYPAFNAPLYYDSTYLEENDFAFFYGGLLKVINLFPQRPLAMTTFYLNTLVTGMNPVSFRVVNALLMAGTALLVMFLIQFVLEFSHSESKLSYNSRKWLGFLFALVFAVHPVQVFMVDYVWQRMALLACFFYYAGLLVFLAVRSDRYFSKPAGYALLFLMFACGMACKENTVMLPVSIVMAEIAFFRSGWKHVAVLAAACAAAMLLAVFGLSFLERAHGMSHHPAGILQTLGKYYQEAGWTPWQVFINQCGALFTYVKLVLWPSPSSVVLIAPQIVARSLSDSPFTLWKVLAAAVYTATGVFLLRKRPAVGFGMLFFLFNLIPESLLVPQYLFVPYRLTLPMLGLFLVFADGTAYVASRLSTDKLRDWNVRITAAFLLCTAIIFGFLTHSKAAIWRSPPDFWAEIVESLPQPLEDLEPHGTVQSLSNLALLQMAAGKKDAAFANHYKAIRLGPKIAITHAVLAIAYMMQGRVDEAETFFKKALAINPKLDTANAGYGELLLSQRRFDEAYERAKAAVNSVPNNPNYRKTLGLTLFHRQNFEGALEHFSKAVEINPRHAEALFLMGKTFSKMNQPDTAAAFFKRVLEVEPDNWFAHNDLGVIYAKSGRFEEAKSHFEQVLRLNPRYKPAKENLRQVVNELQKREKPQSK